MANRREIPWQPILLALLLVAPRVHATPAGECPSSTFRWGYDGSSTRTSVASHDVLDVDAGPNHLHGEFDLAAGTLSSRTISADGTATEVTIASDEYTVTGLAPGTPLSFGVSLRFQGSSGGTCSQFAGCGSGQFAVVIREAGSANADSVQQANGDGVVVIPMTTTAGTPFTLELTARSIAYGYASASEGGFQGGAQVTALLHFRDLPPEASVVSCHGFVPGAVPVRKTTWGALKRLYR